MRTSNGIKKYITAFLIFALLCIGALWGFMLLMNPLIGNTFSSISNCLEPCPAIVPTQGDGGSDQIQDQLKKIDQSLAESIRSSIAYNAPQAMNLDEVVTIELLLNPSVEPSELATQVTEAGQIVTATIQVTPRMKAVLLSTPEDAFTIQPLHDNAEQLIGSTETTTWSWDVTAKKEGANTLTLVIYRLVTVDGSDNWRVVETYRSDIDVEVTLAQRLSMLDWKWVGGIILTALLIPAFWRWYDQRKRNAEPTTANSKREKKK